MVIHEQKRAAAAIPISDRALREWEKVPGFPDFSNGYDIEAIRAWRDQHERKGSAEDKQTQTINRAMKLKQLSILTRKDRQLELANMAKEGELLDRRVYEAFVASLLAGIGDWCEQLPGLLVAEVPAKYGKKLQERAEEELRKMRQQLAEDLKRTPIKE